ncbi:MAG TPA: hypothetical protein VLW45_02075 [Pelomicrobium sp.]|nr:hypothetical protein [Pelomicrobium sp.]
MAGNLPSLAITLRPSVPLGLGLMALHALALGAVAWSGLPASVRLALAAAVGISLAHALATRVFRRGGSAVVALRLSTAGEVSVQTRDGGACTCRVRAESLVHPAIVVLRLGCGRRVRTVLIDAGSVGCDEYRRLRVMLRWGRGTPPTAGAGTTPV